MRNKLRNVPSDINHLASTKLLRQTLPYGIGFHHAGLLPILKDLVEELFEMGKIKVLYTTETFAVGINMPARSVCFESLRKFDGISFRLLNSKEYFQIAGRAGRRGIDKEGFVYAMIPRPDFDYNRIKKITDSDTEPIKSQFKLSVNTVLNLIKHHDKAEIHKILCKSFYAYQKYGEDFVKKTTHRSHSTFESMKKKLEKMEFIVNGKLTWKGDFASKIYADEILISEIFATKFYTHLNEYQMLLVLAAICYEPRERTKIYNLFPTSDLNDLRKSLQKLGVKDNRFRSLKALTGLVSPVFNGKSIFEVFENTNLLEGDVIRLYRQILDRMGQIKNATNDSALIGMLDSCGLVLNNCLKDIDVV